MHNSIMRKQTIYFKNIWMDISLKKVYGWQLKIGKDDEHYYLSGKGKVKPCLLGCIK